MLRLIRIFYEPDAVFKEVAETAAWKIPFIAAVLLAIVTSQVIINTVGFTNIVRMGLEARPQLTERMSPQELEKLVQQSASSPVAKVMAYVNPPVASGLILVLTAALLLALLRMAGEDTPFGKVLGVCSHSYFAYALVTSLISVLVVLMKSDPAELDLQNLVALNVGAFLERPATNKAVYSLASSIDLLSFWYIFLLGLGLSKVSRSVSLGKGIALAGALWAVYVLGKAGLAMLF